MSNAAKTFGVATGVHDSTHSTNRASFEAQQVDVILNTEYETFCLVPTKTQNHPGDRDKVCDMETICASHKAIGLETRRSLTKQMNDGKQYRQCFNILSHGNTAYRITPWHILDRNKNVDKGNRQYVFPLDYFRSKLNMMLNYSACQTKIALVNYVFF